MERTLAQTIYNQSPVWMQNILLSAYGLKLRRMRHGDIYRSHLKHLEKTQAYTRAEMRSLQARELRRLLEHAERHVPWYRQIFAEYGVRPAQIDPDNLGQMLPILERDQVHSNSHLLIAENTNGATLRTINTSGTTGSPLAFKTTDASLQKNYAFFERFLHASGVDSRDRSVTFAGRMLLPPRQTGAPYWRHNWAMNTLLCSSYHISDSTADAYLNRIAAYKPAFIDAYPSAIFTLAQHLLERSASIAIRPTAIITSSETLLEHQRTTIEQAFACPVFDQYGSAEMSACITQCTHGSYHINPEYGIVEVIRSDGLPAAAGESGELVCTGFINDVMPMIRYRIGDSAIASDKDCDCGRPWPVVDSLLGRADDTIVTTDGRRIGRLDPLFKGLQGIKEAQIVQVGHGDIVINIVRTPQYTPDVGASLTHALKLRVGDDMNVDLRFLDQIPRSSSGKFRAVVSRITKAPQSTASES